MSSTPTVNFALQHVKFTVSWQTNRRQRARARQNAMRPPTGATAEQAHALSSLAVEARVDASHEPVEGAPVHSARERVLVVVCLGNRHGRWRGRARNPLLAQLHRERRRVHAKERRGCGALFHGRRGAHDAAVLPRRRKLNVAEVDYRGSDL